MKRIDYFKSRYANTLVYRWLVAVAVGFLVLCCVIGLYKFCLQFGPKLGEVVFDYTHPNQLGTMTFYKDEPTDEKSIYPG
jgi:hypothetical protein